MMQTDVRAARVTTTGDAGLGTTRVKAIHVATPAAATTVTLTDKSTTPNLLWTVDAAPAMLNYIKLPGEGMLFNGGITVNIGTATAVTIIYG
jgi:hypothetical protein